MTILLNLLKIKSIDYLDAVIRGKNNEVDRIYHNSKIPLYQHIEYLIQDPTYIIDNIYLGNSYNSSNFYTLNKFGIEKIINATHEIPCSFKDTLEYLQIPIRDTRDNFIQRYLEKSFQFIKLHKHHSVLIHCYMGSSRSAIIVVYYLIRQHQMKLDEALEFLKKKRSIININHNFIVDLKKELKLLD